MNPLNAPNAGRLRDDLQIIAPGEHGADFLLFDPLTEQYFKIDPTAINFMRLLDRAYSLPELVAKAQAQDLPITAAEIAELMLFLRGNHLLVPEYGQIEQEILRQRAVKAATWFDRLASAYLFFKLPPIYPDAIFSEFTPLIKLVFNRATRWLLMLIALVGFLNLLRHANEVITTFADSLSWAGLVRYFWALVAVKVVHELAHGCTAKALNCRIRAMGISFIVFYPRMFTDVTDAWRLSRRQRLMIDSAGIVAELLLGGLAALLWSYAAPGGFKSTMFYLFAVSTLGTIFVNGNPFIRYDGYYILCDLLGVDNLMHRAGAFVSAVHRNFLLGGGALPDTSVATGIFLYFFGVGAFAYRLFLAFSIVLILYFQFAKPVAIVLMVIEIYAMVWMPLYRELKTLWSLGKRQYMRMFFWAGLFIFIAYYALTLPIPWGYEIAGEIQPTKTTPVYVGEAGYTAAALAEDVRPVAAGELLLPLTNWHLLSNIKRYENLVQQDEQQLEILRSSPTTLNSAKLAYEKLQTDTGTLNEMQRRRDNLVVNAPTAGIFIPKIHELATNRWLEKGTLIGEIVSPEKTITAYIREQDVRRIALLDNVEIVMAQEMTAATGVITAIIPLAARLKDTALVQNFGGEIPCYYDPHTGEFVPTDTYYAVKIKLAQIPESYFVGRTGKIKITKAYSLIETAERGIRHAFLREFSF